MPTLNITHDELKRQLFSIQSLNERQRQMVFDVILQMNQRQDWYPDHFHKAMRGLEDSGALSQFERHAVEQTFFPGHTW